MYVCIRSNLSFLLLIIPTRLLKMLLHGRSNKIYESNEPKY